MNIDDCVCSVQEWLERERIGILKDTYIKLPTTLPSFCWTKQNYVVERTLFGATIFQSIEVLQIYLYIDPINTAL